jgi:hypothetical protein
VVLVPSAAERKKNGKTLKAFVQSTFHFPSFVNFSRLTAITCWGFPVPFCGGCEIRSTGRWANLYTFSVQQLLSPNSTCSNFTVWKNQHYLHGSGLLGSEKQWLWEFTCYRSEMLKHSPEKLNFIPKYKRNERQSRRTSKIFRLPFLISQQKRLFDQSSSTI